jgi:hypothetical protein
MKMCSFHVSSDGVHWQAHRCSPFRWSPVLTLQEQELLAVLYKMTSSEEGDTCRSTQSFNQKDELCDCTSMRLTLWGL